MAFTWVKAVCRAFGGGSGLDQVIWFVILSESKTPFRGLQNICRGEWYSAGRIDQSLEKVSSIHELRSNGVLRSSLHADDVQLIGHLVDAPRTRRLIP